MVNTDTELAGFGSPDDQSYWRDAILAIEAEASRIDVERLARALEPVTRNLLYQSDKQGQKWRRDTAAAIAKAYEAEP
jgi:hypothetical protein